MSELPNGWAMTTISDITEYLSRGKQPKYTSYSSLPVINQRAIRWFGIQSEYLKYIDPVQFDQWEPERFIQSRDILWNSTGTGTLGRACLIKPHDLEPPKVVDSHVTIVRPNQTAIDPRFLFSWIQSTEVQENIASLATGATNQIELSRATIASRVFRLLHLRNKNGLLISSIRCLHEWMLVAIDSIICRAFLNAFVNRSLMLQHQGNLQKIGEVIPRETVN